MSDLLRIATSGLLSSQKSLDTIANNISNASVPEYNRQVTTLGTLPSLQIGKLFYGSGVDVQGTQRILNQFVMEAMVSQNTAVGQSQAQNNILDQVDKLFSDPTLGITNGLNNFFDALQTLNSEPASIPARSIFNSQGNILAARFNEIYDQIYEHFSTINAETNESVLMINKYAQQIADINLKMQTLGGGSFGAAPNELLDLRDRILLDLSKYVGIVTNKKSDDTVDVFIGNGQTLVINSQTIEFSTAPNADEPFKLDVVINSNGIANNINSFFQTGKIAGLIEIRENVLPNILNAIGRIAITIASTVNNVHKQGIDLYGDIGGLMFTDYNDYDEKVSRVKANVHNLGDGVLSVTINPIASGNHQNIIYTDAVPFTDAGTLVPLTANQLTINGVNIRATLITDDIVSTTDNLSSALAISNAINSQTSAHLIRAQATQSTYNLGQFTTGAIAAGNLAINGIQLISTGSSIQTLIDDINNLKFQTGVIAQADENNNISLVAPDGRNIQLVKAVNSAGATFSYFSLNAGAALNKVIRGSIKLTSPINHEITIAGNNPSSVGFVAQTVPIAYESLSTDDYQLSYDGQQYTLRKIPDLSIVAQSNVPTFTLDGFTLQLETGSISAGDIYTIHPTQDAARKLNYKISDAARIALASPIKAQNEVTNKGTATIQVVGITNTTGIPAAQDDIRGNAFSVSRQLTPPIQIQFTSNSSYIVLDMSLGLPGIQIGPEQHYDNLQIANPVFPIAEVMDNTPPGPNNNYVYDPGYRLSITGNAQTGDIFNIVYNEDASGDNANGLLMSNLQFEKLMQNSSSTFQDSYTQFIGEIGSQALQSKISFDASSSLFKSIETRRNEISGVNLDEEAANLLRFEQSYQACAQVIFIAKGVFDSLLRAVGG